MNKEEALQKMNYWRNLAVSLRTLGMDVSHEDAHVIANIIKMFETREGNPTINDLAIAIDEAKANHSTITDEYYKAVSTVSQKD